LNLERRRSRIDRLAHGMLLAWAMVSVACHSDRRAISGGGADRFGIDACTTVVYVPPISCGGTVATSGSTPAGGFAADAVSGSLKCAGTPILFSIAVADSASGDAIFVNVSRVGDGGASVFLGVHPASAQLFSLTACGVFNAGGTVTVSGGDDPITIGSGTGSVSGTFSFVANGFNLSGSFSTPYCLGAGPCG